MLTPRLKIVCPSLVRLKSSGHSSVVLWRVFDNSAGTSRNTSSTTCSLSRRNFWSVAARRRPEKEQNDSEAAVLRSMEHFLVDEASCGRDFEPGTSKRDDLQTSTVVLEYFSSRVSPVSVQFLPYSSPRFHAVAADERWSAPGEPSTTDTKRLYSKKAKPPAEPAVTDELSLTKLLHLDTADVKRKPEEAEFSASSPLFFPRSHSRQSSRKTSAQEPSPSASEHLSRSCKEGTSDRDVHKTQQRSQALTNQQSSGFDGKPSQRPNFVVGSVSVKQPSPPSSKPLAMDGQLSLSRLFGLESATTSPGSGRTETSPAATKAAAARHVSKPASTNAEPTGKIRQRPTSTSLPPSDRASGHAKEPAEESDVSLTCLFGLGTAKMPSRTDAESTLSKSLERSPVHPGSTVTPGTPKYAEERRERPSSARQVQSKSGQRDARPSNESGEISLSSLFGLEPVSASTVNDKFADAAVARSGSKPRSGTKPSSTAASPSETPSQRPSSTRLSPSRHSPKSHEEPATASEASLSALFDVQANGASSVNGTKGASSKLPKASAGHDRSTSLPATMKHTSTLSHAFKPCDEQPPKRPDAEQITLSGLFGVELPKTSLAVDDREASSKISKDLDGKKAAKSRSEAKTAGEFPSQTPIATRPLPSKTHQQRDVTPVQEGNLSLASLLGVELAKTSPAVDGREASSKLPEASDRQRAAKSRPGAKTTSEYPTQTPIATRPVPSKTHQQRDVNPGQEGELSLMSLLGVVSATKPPASDAAEASPTILASAAAHSDDANAASSARRNVDGAPQRPTHSYVPASQNADTKSDEAGIRAGSQPSQKPMDDGYVSLAGLFGVEAKKRNFDATQVARHATIPRRLQTGTQPAMIGEEVHFAWTSAKGQSVISTEKPSRQSNTRKNGQTSRNGPSWGSPGSFLFEGGYASSRGPSPHEGAPLFFPPSDDRSSSSPKTARRSRRRSGSRGPQKNAK